MTASNRPVPPKQSPASDVDRVMECLSVLADAIETMRAAVGKAGPPPNAAKMEFAREHDHMLTTFIVAMTPFVKPLRMNIPTLSYSRGNAVLECWWREKRLR